MHKRSFLWFRTAGQIMAAGQWYSPVDPSSSSYGNNRTVGCLVYLDDNVSYTTHLFFSSLNRLFLR